MRPLPAVIPRFRASGSSRPVTHSGGAGFQRTRDANGARKIGQLPPKCRPVGGFGYFNTNANPRWGNPTLFSFIQKVLAGNRSKLRRFTKFGLRQRSSTRRGLPLPQIGAGQGASHLRIQETHEALESNTIGHWSNTHAEIAEGISPEDLFWANARPRFRKVRRNSSLARPRDQFFLMATVLIRVRCHRPWLNNREPAEMPFT